MINVFAITFDNRKNINPIRPEAQQLIGLHKTGKVKVTVMCNHGSILVDYFTQYGIEVITDPFDKKMSWASIRRIRAELLERKINILHLFTNIAIRNGATAAIGLKNLKVIAYRGQTGNVNKYDPSCYLTMLHPRLDKIICVAKAVEDDLANYMPAKKLVTVYKGHDQSWYQKEATDLAWLKLPEDAFIISLVARLRPRKGLHVLMDALQKIPVDAKIHTLLVGADPDNQQIKEMIEKSGRSNSVYPLGFRLDAPEIAAASDLVILPTTKREGLCRAVLEANSYGTPAVVSDTGGNAELVKHEVSGLVVPPGDAEVLAEAIMDLYTNKVKCKQFGLAAKQRVIEKFNVKQGVDATLEVYEQLLKSH